MDGEAQGMQALAVGKEAAGPGCRSQGLGGLHVQEPLSFQVGAAPIVAPLQHQRARGCLPLEKPLGMPVKIQILGWGSVLAGRDTSGGLAGGSVLLLGRFSLINPASRKVASQSLGLGCDPGSGDGQKGA